MKKKLSLLLILCMLFSYVPSLNVLVSQAKVNTDVSLKYNNAEVSNLVISRTESYKLVATYSVITGHPKYSWQVYAGDQWVNFYDATDKTFNLTYAKISSLMDGNSARIRCGVTTGDDTYYSNQLTIIVEEETDDIKTDPADGITTYADDTSIYEGTDDYVFVAICYRDSKSNEQIYSPYTARIESGTTFHQTITSPTF